mmetsp:Transcript_33557/g.56143  ORF Transcript_33557/g.56143 Transcript_33557/m.56143 type:complete len:98 (+) Transcript_33557:191-484(+)
MLVFCGEIFSTSFFTESFVLRRSGYFVLPIDEFFSTNPAVAAATFKEEERKKEEENDGGRREKREEKRFFVPEADYARRKGEEGNHDLTLVTMCYFF